MLTNLYLVRHAHSIYTPDELERPLSEGGFAGAQTVTELLKEENIDYVYSSPYKRAMQTIEGLARYIDKEIHIENDFKERILAEKPVENFTIAITKVWEDDDFSWSGGESNRIAQKRGCRAILQVLESHKGKNVVISTHGNIMVLIMNYFDSSYGFDFWKKLDMPDIYKCSFNEKKLIEVQRIWKNSTL
ncbi:phosphoglycerate mutase [Lederbergia ruris]|uniref:Phosphoglycerate mutase n=1 Tax=Lederbergia ruris TaxID=217495 RepID=A0ABQ4KIW5_9BACI|nr:phosphoglycerate mutase [Lederbergia ruris]